MAPTAATTTTTATTTATTTISSDLQRRILKLLVASLVVVAALTSCSSAEPTVNYLLFSSSNSTPTTQRLQDLLQDSNHNHASEAIDSQTANDVWQRMRQNALEFAQRKSQEARPTIERLLKKSNITRGCSQSINGALDHLAKLDQWAVQMYNAFGDFPASGFFEGSFTSMGSYHQCVDLEPNELIGFANYCTFKFQPIVPKRPRYHNILAAVDGLANFTNKDDMFQLLAKKAHYFYYTKLRVATCMPGKCDEADLEKLGKQVTCLRKEKDFDPDEAQIFALSILIALAAISIVGTLVHVLNLRKYFLHHETGGCNSNNHHISISSNNNHNHNHSSNGNNNAKEQHYNNNQVVAQQQALLTGQQKSTVIPQPLMQGSIRGSSQILSTIDILMHFSILENSRKLFDTSTSRHTRPTNHGSAGDGTSEHSQEVAGEPPKSADISCIHGLRFWTISWIIFGHTMQYTEWAGFARAFQVEQNIVSFYLQPLMNATFSVDTFFLISGLLTTYVTWSITGGDYKKFNKFAFLISRYLRLTPQVMLVVLLFILFPLMGEGPYWKGLIQKESDNCKQNWWVNALYLQAFIKQDHICNLVTWWLSIEMFYHFISIFVIIALLNSTRKGLAVAATMGSALTAISCYLHYVNHYPPNMLPTLLQRYEVWDSIVLKFFWTPYPHAPSYFVGLVLGYFLYSKRVGKISQCQVKYGWLAFTVCYLSILFGTYSWNKNAPYARLTSTMYYNVSQVFWSLATGWAILACAMGHGGWLNSFLSSPVFVPLGRATYMTYLSHMLIVMSYPAKMNLLIEPSYVVFLYIFIANLVLAYSFGIFLTLVYESPILHLQKMLVKNMAQKFNEDLQSNKVDKTNDV